MTRLSCGVPCVFHAGFTIRALVMSLLMWCTSSVPRVFNCKRTHNKSMCNKGDKCWIIDFYMRETCRHMRVLACMSKFKLSCTIYLFSKLVPPDLTTFLHYCWELPKLLSLWYVGLITVINHDLIMIMICFCRSQYWLPVTTLILTHSTTATIIMATELNYVPAYVV